MTARKLRATFLFLAILMMGGFLIFVSVAKASTGTGSGDKFNPPYPRIGVFIWTANPEWFGQKGINLAVWAAAANISVEAVKKNNPRVLVGATGDINRGGFCEKEEYKLIGENGKCILYWGNSCLYDYTKPGFQDCVAKAFAALNPKFDFLMTDGLYDNLNHIKTNIFEETRRLWPAGKRKILQGISDLTNQKPFIVNGDNCGGKDKDLYNGSLMEYGQPFISNWGAGLGSMLLCQKNRLPHLAILDGNFAFGVYDAKGTKFPGGGNEFKVMRFSLATALLSDVFFSFQRLGGNLKDHFYVGYFDEYDLDLGYPKGGPHCLKSTGRYYQSQCLYVRFFDKGAMILNATGEEKTISDSDLKKLSGYSGPYYRFRGGQDPTWNNGQQFSSVNLAGYKHNTAPEGSSAEANVVFGDALILLKEPLAVVADIIVDDNKMVTSPGSNAVELVGEWEKSIKGNGFWHQYHSSFTNVPASYYGFSKIKNDSAIFRPTIGVSGRYTIYEWHGDSLETETSSASFEIKSGNGVKTGTINQSQNYGKWNKIGEEFFGKGVNNYVKITNTGSGVLVADAVKFVYNQAKPKADFNCDDTVDIVDFGILLSRWNQSGVLTFKHANCQAAKDLDLNKLGNSKDRIDVLDVGTLLGCWGNPGNEACVE